MASNTTARSLEAGVQIGDFRIERRLGAGGMGIVYRARQVSLNRVVALKVLGGALTRPIDIVHFQREAQAAARLNHPNIATVHFVGQESRRERGLSRKSSSPPEYDGRLRFANWELSGERSWHMARWGAGQRGRFG